MYLKKDINILYKEYILGAIIIDKWLWFIIWKHIIAYKDWIRHEITKEALTYRESDQLANFLLENVWLCAYKFKANIYIPS